MARPAKLTDEVIRLICAGIRTGATLDDAAAVAGVGRSSIYNWMRIGEQAHTYNDRLARGTVPRPERKTLTPLDDACEHLFVAVREARAAFAIEHADAIVSAALLGAMKTTTITRTERDAKGNVVAEHTETRTEQIPPDARASMWLLERRLPLVFGTRGRLEISGPDGGEIPIPTDALREDLLAKLMEIHALPPAAPGEKPIDAEVVDVEELRGVLSLARDVDGPGEPPETADQQSNDAEAASGAEGS